MTTADIRALFPGLTDTIYMNTATMSVGCKPARDAYERAAERWSAGRFDWVEAERAGEDARALFAQIIGATPGVRRDRSGRERRGRASSRPTCRPPHTARTSSSPRTSSARTIFRG